METTSLSKMNLGAGTPKVITLYHGSPYKDVVPTFGKGNDHHDYGRGFYLTPDVELAKEWAVGRYPDSTGWLHSYKLDCTDLDVLNFETLERNRALYWVTELLRHREPDEFHKGNNYSIYRSFLLKKFDAHSDRYDVIQGWRADDSYFKIAASFLSDGLAVSLLEEALRLGDLGVQCCCRSKRAFEHLTPSAEPVRVDSSYHCSYLERDLRGRAAFQELCDSPANSVLSNRIVLGDLVRAYVKGGGKL